MVDQKTFPTFESIANHWQQEEAKMQTYLDSLSDNKMEGIVQYEAEGNSVKRVLWHCLWHMVNHGTQHRSQCAAMLKDANHHVGSMDFTFYMNQQNKR